MPSFAELVIAWHHQHGRHGLPWQMDRNKPNGPYRVWLSEIMLQQTQVKTVLIYYDKFLAHYPTVETLAAAPLDDVLALWSGMGYYTRARNLHAAARQVMTEFGGEFPKTAMQLEALRGVGRSTAAAIAAFCFGERVAILDVNVKRVLTRVLAFEGDMAKAAQVSALWSLATDLLPTHHLKNQMPAYTQALMDIGATVCHARSPDCKRCPVAKRCKASLNKASSGIEITHYPVKTNKLKRSTESLWLLHASNSVGEVWLTQRAIKPENSKQMVTSGVWAGLFCLPIFESEAALRAALPIGAEPLETALQTPRFKHVLTHKDLWLHVVQVTLPLNAKLEPIDGRWYSQNSALKLGLPAPIKKLLLATKS